MFSRIVAPFIFLIFFNTVVSGQWVRVNGLDSFSINSIAVNQTNGFLFVVAYQNTNFMGLFSKPNIYDPNPWTNITKGLGTVKVNKVAISPEGTFYLGTANGVYFVNENDSCESINQGLPANFGIYPSVNSITVIDTFLYIGTNNGVFRKLRTQATNWQPFSQNLPLGVSPNRILKYRNSILASYSNNVYRTEQGAANWIGADSIAMGQGIGTLTIEDMAASDSIIYVAVSGAWSNTFKSIGDSMVFTSCAETNYLSSYSIFSINNQFWTGTFYGGIYKGTGRGNDLAFSNPNLPAWASVKSIDRYGTGLLAGTEYYSFQTGSGGLYYGDFTVLAANDYNFKAYEVGQSVKISWQDIFGTETQKFELQKFDNAAGQFKTIAAFHHSASSKNYNYQDYDIKNPGSNILYRLKEFCLNGEIQYSPTIRVDLNTYLQFTVHPNPARDKITVIIPENISLQKCNLLVYNSLGVLKLNIKAINQRQLSVDVSALSKGLYWLKIESPEVSLSKALMVE
ncbi:MAG: T9SS type A sorting domain-containing protein [Chitinophagaceae bacterium]|nr:T9SS type A sorting domain-containing protein [Chitinophagaceae bacterium]